VSGEFINCREGALRRRRSLRDLYTGFAASLPMVGVKIFHRDQRECSPKGYTSHEVTAPRAVGRPTGFERRRLDRKAMMRSVLFERGRLV
jgi:hypothetical protein